MNKILNLVFLFGTAFDMAYWHKNHLIHALHVKELVFHSLLMPCIMWM